ncbi:hypothetical protein WOLCODRAFT_151463 [Wolfiporia cocos MD-104 SS10]|uniref:Uncharacterized protein n=1 Tax=Wolfiporia cocos (strain MD-104) TaxID=742152 RepID=A0A2H3JHS3_WOLCO|nr:hypothetical protein WOLCODRAFT_151463 [Wolfiporia cocos MD-104 SS10]
MLAVRDPEGTRWPASAPHAPVAALWLPLPASHIPPASQARTRFCATPPDHPANAPPRISPATTRAVARLLTRLSSALPRSSHCPSLSPVSPPAPTLATPLVSPACARRRVHIHAHSGACNRLALLRTCPGSPGPRRGRSSSACRPTHPSPPVWREASPPPRWGDSPADLEFREERRISNLMRVTARRVCIAI